MLPYEALDFELPPAAVAGWGRWLDTSRDPPEDIAEAAAAPIVRDEQYRVAPRSVAAVLVQTPRTEPTPEVADADIANPASA